MYGDIIDRSGLLRHTIQARVSKGFGAISTILAIVNEVPLAHWKILEKVDESLLRGLLKAHAKVPQEALHLEKVHPVVTCFSRLYKTNTLCFNGCIITLKVNVLEILLLHTCFPPKKNTMTF